MRLAQLWRRSLWMGGLMVVASATLCWAQDDAEKEPAPRIEIRGIGEGGGFGGGGFDFALPKGFEEMMKAAQEMQTLQAKYQTSVDELIAAAKELENAENLMDSVTKVAKLAKKSEELKGEIAKKQEEMTKKIGGGAFGIGGIGGAIGGGGIGDGGVKIVPFTPKVEFKIDGIQLEVAPEKAPVDRPAEEQ